MVKESYKVSPLTKNTFEEFIQRDYKGSIPPDMSFQPKDNTLSVEKQEYLWTKPPQLVIRRKKV